MIMIMFMIAAVNMACKNHLINLSSEDGAKLLSDVCTGFRGNHCQQKLVDIFTKQKSYKSCGLVSAALVLSAYHLNPTAKSGSPFTEQNMFDMPATCGVISQQKMDKNGKLN